MPLIDTSIEGGQVQGVQSGDYGSFPAAQPVPSAPGNDLFNMLAQSNLFAPQVNDVSMMDPGMGTPGTMGTGAGGVSPVQGLQPDISTPAFDAFQALLGDRPDGGISALTKIASVMMSLVDPRLAMDLLNRPNSDLVDWQNQVNNAGDAAEMEQRFMDIQGRAEGRDIQRSGQELESRRISNTAAALEQRIIEHDNPNLQKVELADGVIGLFDPGRGTITATEYNTGELNPAEKAGLEIATAEHKAEITDAYARGLIDYRDVRTDENRIQDAAASAASRADQGEITRRNTRERQAGQGGPDNLSEGDRTKRIQNNMVTYVMNNPEDSVYFNFDNEGVPIGLKELGKETIDTSWWPGGQQYVEDDEKRQQIVKEILRGTQGTIFPISSTGTGTQQSAPPPVRNSETHIDVIKDGVKQSVPIEQLQAVLDMGWEVAP